MDKIVNSLVSCWISGLISSWIKGNKLSDNRLKKLSVIIGWQSSSSRHTYVRSI